MKNKEQKIYCCDDRGILMPTIYDEYLTDNYDEFGLKIIREDAPEDAKKGYEELMKPYRY